ncbi:MAG TPA: hypothetical protein DHU56_04365 [Marinobacter sp.]|nr:hypothetical protein [Marinobacter sp.]
MAYPAGPPGPGGGRTDRATAAVRRTVAEKVTDCEGQQIRFTVSIGVALGTPAPDDLAESYLRGADKALYRAKQKGRNRVEVSSPDQPG